MKRLVLLFCALALLSGCGGEKAPSWTPTPVTPPTPVPTPSPAPAPVRTEGDPWWSGVDPDQLPADWSAPSYSDGGVTYTLRGLDAGAGVALYEVSCAEFDFVQLLLSKDGLLGQPGTLPGPADTLELFWEDFDGDGAAEAALPLGSALTLCEWEEGLGWTFHTYAPEDYSAELSAALTFDYRACTATLTYGRTTVSYTLGPGDAGPALPLKDFSQLAFLRPGGGSISATFGVGASVDGDPRYFGSVMATVEYDGEGFALRGLRLLATGGV